MSASRTVESWLWDYCPDGEIGFVRGKLGQVLFGKDDIGKKLGQLSGGESARLVLAKLGIVKPTVLVLDEPTNHLDLEGIEALVKGLLGYDGTIIFVSHDRWFVSKVATRIVEISRDGIEDFAGSTLTFDDTPSDAHASLRTFPHWVMVGASSVST